ARAEDVVVERFGDLEGRDQVEPRRAERSAADLRPRRLTAHQQPGNNDRGREASHDPLFSMTLVTRWVQPSHRFRFRPRRQTELCQALMWSVGVRRKESETDGSTEVNPSDETPEWVTVLARRADAPTDESSDL